MIDIAYHDTVAVVKLARSVTNALSLEHVERLARALDDVKSNPEVRGLVLAGSNDKFFSIGFDIPRLIDLSRKDFGIFYRTFNQLCLQLLVLPKPTVAAIAGHAIAGGCVLVLCCDYRFIAEGRKLMGLNEIKLGVPVPYPADCILRDLVGNRNARDVMEKGEFYQAEESLGIGMVDRVLALEEVLEKSIEKARLLGSMPREAYGVIKQNRVAPIERKIAAHGEEREKLFLDCWFSGEARLRLKKAMENF